MNRAELTAELMSAADRIAIEEEHATSYALAAMDFERVYDLARGAVLTATAPDGSPVLNGRNEAVREAQLAERLTRESADLHTARRNLESARSRLRCAQARFSALKMIARLLAGGGD